MPKWQQTTLATWGGRGLWAVIDQSLFALSNFLLNILLARWLAPEEYGAFAVAYTIFLLLGTLHTGILVEPMQVFGPGKHKERLGHYLYVLIKGHILFSLIAGLLFAIAAVSLWPLISSPLSSAVGGMAFALPFILFQWLLRRACYVHLTPHRAAQAGVLYMILVLVGLFAFYRSDRLSSASALIVMGSASLLSGLWLLRRLNVTRASVNPEGLERGAMQDHWRYGRWAMVAALLSWVPGNVALILLPIWHGLEAAAILRALNNVLMPIVHINTALGALLLPALVHARQLGRDHMMRLGRNATVFFMAGTVVYWLFLGFFAEPAMAILYDSRYTEHASVLWVLGFLPVAGTFVLTAGALLRAMERPDRVVRAYAVSTALSLTVGVFPIWFLGLTGAVAFMILSSIVAACLLWFHVSVEIPRNPLSSPG